MSEKRIRVEKQIGRQTLSFETGQLAKQAAGSVLVQYGETVVLVATASSDPRPGLDFFPLTCDYRERLAAAGKFPGGFLKREGRPSTKEIILARLVHSIFHSTSSMSALSFSSVSAGNGPMQAHAAPLIVF